MVVAEIHQARTAELFQAEVLNFMSIVLKKRKSTTTQTMKRWPSLSWALAMRGWK